MNSRLLPPVLRRLSRLMLALALVSLLAASCSSSDGDAEAVTTNEQTETAEGGEGSGDSETSGDTDTPEPAFVGEATSIPVPDSDSAADDAIAGLDGEAAAPADPTTTAQTFVRNLFNIDPSAEALQCIVDQGPTDEALETALANPNLAAGRPDDASLKALTIAMNGCVDTLGLADWTTQAVGPRGDVAEAAPACFAARFEGENGDRTFYNVAALNYQYRLDTEGIPDVIDAFVECTPIASLTDFFAEQGEAALGFTTEVDRDCLATALEPDDVSRTFWSAFVEGGQPTNEIIDPFVQGCSSEVEIEPPAVNPTDPLPADFVAWSGNGALSSVLPSARAGIYSSPPPMTIDPAGSYEAVIVTGGGEIRIRLFADTAPLTVNNFVNLVRDGYYDGTIFHRVLQDFMAQGGDPTGTGTGGPGYQFADEVDNPAAPALDRKGLLAMANAGPGTNGSQFFITFVPTEWLTGNHTVFGEVIEGIELVDAIQLRDPSNPNSPAQQLESVTIIES